MSAREIKANELKDVDVQFVSLVKRGANRIPFRLTKQDTSNMSIDFNALFRKSDDAAAATAKAVADKLAKAESDKTAAIEAAKALLKAEGLTITKAEEVELTPEEIAAAKVAKDKAAKDAAIEAEVAELEKAEALLKAATPEALAAKVNKSKNKEKIDGAATAASTDAPGGDNADEQIAKKPVVGNDVKLETANLVKKFEEGQVALAKSFAEQIDKLVGLVKAGQVETDAKITSMETKVAKAESAVSSKVLGAANDDGTAAPVRKSNGVLPPPLDTAFMKIDD